MYRIIFKKCIKFEKNDKGKKIRPIWTTCFLRRRCGGSGTRSGRRPAPQAGTYRRGRSPATKIGLAN